MHPTYKNGDIVLATRKFEIQKNDIVVAKDEYGEFIIKRVKYIPGDFYYFYLIYSDKPEKVFINNDSYNSIKNYKNLNIKLFETELEKNQYFLIGDNSNHSDDSRRFGPVYKEDIIYKVIR